MRFMSFVETFQEGSCWSSTVELVSAIFIEQVPTMVSVGPLWRHQKFVEVASLAIMPLRLVNPLVANINHEVNVSEVGFVSMGSEMVTEEDLCLFWSGSVLTNSVDCYIS